jgi:hypothetical protein
MGCHLILKHGACLDLNSLGVEFKLKQAQIVDLNIGVPNVHQAYITMSGKVVARSARCQVGE